MQTHLSDHLHGIVMAQFTIKNKVHDLESITNLLQQALHVLLDKTQRWVERHLPTVAILAPFGRPRGPLDFFVDCACAAASQAFSTCSVTTG